ncbi:hypothetical protein M9Y10_023316 [Tritrichomonas musculus]|uniref:Uncharacterized protein n=1 Tax=Tritrichomonas musculus TaxID=1915356 RepID=A0ABR2KVQ6_9EUKA
MKQSQKIDQESTLITVNKVKISDVSTYIWSELEDILVAVPIDYKDNQHKRSKGGTLVITYGAIYIFKNKLLSELPPKYTLSLLDANTVKAFENSSLIVMTFPDKEITIKTKHCVKILEIMAKIIAECTYGLAPFLILPRFTISHEKREYDENGEIEDNIKSKKKKSLNQSKNESLIAHGKDSSTTEDGSQGIKLSETIPKSGSSSPKKVHFDNTEEEHIPLGNKPLSKFPSYFYNEDINGRVDVDNENTRRIRMSDLVKSRPKNALVKRSLLLAHFYDIAGSNLDDCEYLSKYDKNPINTLTIGPHFRPGKFAFAYGHALGWEANLEKLTFLHFKPSKFGNLLEALFINSANVTHITFVDYNVSAKPPPTKKKDDDKNDDDDDDDDPFHNRKRMMEHKMPQNIYIPDFSFTNVKKTNVKSIFFHDCAFPVISAFLDSCESYGCPIEEFAITQCNLLVTDIVKVLRVVSSLECFLKIRCLGFLGDKIPQFPIDQLPPLLSICSCLENLVISEVEADGSQVLAAVCNSKTPLKVLKLNNLSFHTNFTLPNSTLPAALMHIDFTKSSFSALAFKDIMALITGKRKSDLLSNVDRATVEFAANAQKNPNLMIKMASIILNKDGYESFKNFNYSAMQSNIVEFDWSNNKLPGPVVPFFFKFLNTQKNMRILILNNIRLEKQALFFKKLTQYVLDIKLPGLDMAARLYRKFLFTFYDDMKNQPFIRRFCVVGRGGGDDYVSKYIELIPTLPNLTEIRADGFLARNLELLLILWREIYKSKTIKANDFPLIDLSFLHDRCSVDIDDVKFKQMLGNFVRGRTLPSYMMQRVDFIIQGLKKRNESLKDSCPDFESDFFIASCSMPWIDSTPQAIVNEIETEKKIRISKSILLQDNDDSDAADVSPGSSLIPSDMNANTSVKIRSQKSYAENDEFLEDQNELQQELIETEGNDEAEEDETEGANI